MSRSMIAFTSSLALCLACGDDAPPPPAPTVATAEPVRGTMTLAREGFEESVDEPMRIESGATLTTASGARGAFRHDGGAWVLLDRDSSAELTLEAILLEGGRAFVDARDAEVVLRTAQGELRAQDATFAVDAREGTRVYCGSGEVTWIVGDADGHLAQGEELIMDDSPEAEAATLWDDWTGGLADPSPRREASASYVGVLAGRRLEEFGVARRPISVRAHEVDVALRGDMAITEVVQTFFNAESAVLEAEYKARIPEGAIVSGFAVDAGGGFVEGEITPMASDGYALSYQHPSVPTSRLGYDGVGKVRARVYPIAAGQTLRVKLRYTEWLSRRGGRRTYVYPMVQEGVAPPLVGELRIRVDTSGQHVGAFRAGMGATVDDGEVTLRRSDFRPSADFYVDLVDSAEATTAPGAAAYVVSAPRESTPYLGNAAMDTAADDGDEQFVFFDIPAQSLDLPDAEEAPLELVLVVDVSGATEREDLELASAVVETVLRQLAPTDRVTLMLGDVRGHVPEGIDAELAPASPEMRERLLEALARAPLGGATDLAATLRDASTRIAGRPRGAVLYLGDGVPTTGALDASAIKRTLATIDGAPRLFALAVGQGANLDLLRTLADGAEAVEERTQAARSVMRILAEAARPMLRDLRLDLGQDVERVYPRPPLTVPVDGAIRVVGRLRGTLPANLTLTGTRDGAAFENTIAVRRANIDDQGDIRRRWALARLRELLDEDAGREALVELGVRFGILSPWTSFVVDGAKPGPYSPVEGFDPDPRSFLGLFAAAGNADDAGWRRRRPSDQEEVAVAPESTWVERLRAGADANGATGEAGLGRAAAERTLAQGERGPRACYERRLVTRPDLSGVVLVDVQVDGAGEVKEVDVKRSTLDAADVTSCVITEIRGLRFPATDGGVVRVEHSYVFEPATAIGVRNRCSDASRQDLRVRSNLWRERLAANGGVSGALSVWNEARSQCELDGWRARRTLLDAMLRHVGGVGAEVTLYQRLRGDASVAGYLRRAILSHVRTARDLAIVRNGLGLEAPVDWDVFSRLWARTTDPEARLRLVRRWLEVLPEEMSLRLHLLALLEETGKIDEAKRLARELRADPLADANVLTAVGEFLLRQGDEAGSRRVFSELVEYAPYDPWARRRLGDLYRAHGWFDDAYREYGSLARLVPDSPEVLLLLAKAAAGAGRTDEALRLEQRVAESAEPGEFESLGGIARLLTTFRLVELQRAAAGDEGQLAQLARRKREAGVLRDAPAVLAGLLWDHPSDQPALFVRIPSTPEDEPLERAAIRAPELGLEAQAVEQRTTDDTLRFEVRRADRDALRDTRCTLVVIEGLGTPSEQVRQQAITLTRDTRAVAFDLTSAGLVASEPTRDLP